MQRFRAIFVPCDEKGLSYLVALRLISNEQWKVISVITSGLLKTWHLSRQGHRGFDILCSHFLQKTMIRIWLLVHWVVDRGKYIHEIDLDILDCW